ncbi:MAG: serine hydrolase [Gammaproteobacteria bacterium]|jgi:CubicO group peptidase (beta-lactamase class C family)|nr:serine hydrolase [Gammaproteobacteria bacterium]
MTKHFKKIIITMALLTFSMAVYAQENESAIEAAPIVDIMGTPALTSDDVSAWLDGFMPFALEVGDIVGAVVTVVKDGEVLANRGYGYADLATGETVNPAETLFRPGSISKLFTWTSVMQLVEQDRIDLDVDVNTYLDFDLPTNRGIVTMRHLMTHTAGFQEVLKDLFFENQPFEDADLREYLVSHIPQQIYNSGTMPAYSNYSTSLAGYIVEKVSGESLIAYIENHIFTPLNMTRSSFSQPLPESLAADMSKGYQSMTDGRAQSFEVIVPMPAGALSSTGDDMAKFMLAYLNQGAGLMLPETANQMFITLDNQFPPLNGFALGFYREDRNGLNIISHGGDTMWFHSNMSLLVDHGVGLYVSVNSSGGLAAAPIRNSLLAEFTDRYFPYEADINETLPTSLEHSEAVAGIYESSRGGEGNFTAVLRYLSHFQVTATEEGALITPVISVFPGTGDPMFEIAPWVWQSKSGRRFAARVNDGVVTALATDPAAFTFTPVPWYRSSTWLNPTLMGALVVILLTFIAWPIRAIARWRFNVPFSYQGPRKMAYRLAPVAALLILLYLLSWGVFITWIGSSVFNFAASRSENLLMMLYFFSILPLIAVVLSITAARTVITDSSTWFQKVSSILLVVSLFIVIWFSAVVGFFSFETGF